MMESGRGLLVPAGGDGCGGWYVFVCFLQLLFVLEGNDDERGLEMGLVEVSVSGVCDEEGIPLW